MAAKKKKSGGSFGLFNKNQRKQLEATGDIQPRKKAVKKKTKKKK